MGFLAQLDTGLLVIAVQASTFGLSFAVLPLLYGQARYVALESADARPQSMDDMASATNEPSALPTPATLNTPARPRVAPSAAAVLTTRPAWESMTPRQRILGRLFGKATLIGVLFAYAMSGVLSLFGFVLLDAAGFNRDVLWGQWRISMSITLSCVVVLVPLAACILLTSQSRSTTTLRKLMWSFVPYTLWVILFLKVPIPPVDSKAGGQGFSWLVSSLLMRTAVIGVTLVAILSGSAAMAAPWDAWSDLQLYRSVQAARRGAAGGRRPLAYSALLVSREDVENAQVSFKRTLADLEEKRAQLAQLEAEEAAERASPTAPPPSLLGRLNPFAAGSSRVQEIKVLRSEIWALEKLGQSMREDLDALRERERRIQWTKTKRGRALIGLSFVFALYCVYRMLVSLLCLLIIGYPDRAPPDTVAFILACLLRVFGIDADVAAWTREISLLLIGVLIAMRMRTVLSYLSSAFKVASSGSSSNFLILFLTEITTMYLLATLIQLRASLPPAQQSGDAPSMSVPLGSDQVGQLDASSSGPEAHVLPLLSSLPSFQVVFGSLFDSAFLLSAAVTGVFKWLAHSNEAESALALMSSRD